MESCRTLLDLFYRADKKPETPKPNFADVLPASESDKSEKPYASLTLDDCELPPQEKPARAPELYNVPTITYSVQGTPLEKFVVQEGTAYHFPGIRGLAYMLEKKAVIIDRDPEVVYHELACHLRDRDGELRAYPRGRLISEGF